jgi:hypothetical protein
METDESGDPRSGGREVHAKYEPPSPGREAGKQPRPPRKRSLPRRVLSAIWKEVTRSPLSALAAALAVLVGCAAAPASASVDYPFLEYDQPSTLNGFFGQSGSNNLQRTVVTDTRVGSSGGALRLDYNLTAGDFGFYFERLWADRPSHSYLDFDNVFPELARPPVGLDRLDFWVRGSGATTNVHAVKVELKDESSKAVSRYVEIADSATNWTKQSLALDVNDASSWSGDTATIQRGRLTTLAFVVEASHNPHLSGSFHLDEVAFVDEGAQPLDPNASADSLLNRLSLRAFQYYLDWRDPTTGLWQDRSDRSVPFSVAATGFGLSAMAVGDARRWIDHDLAVAHVKQALGQLADGQQPDRTAAESTTQNGYRGFFYHFLDEQGQRDPGSELSPVDTALLLMGVLHVREHFGADEEIVGLADELYRRVNWPWMRSTAPPGLFHRAWKPECGGDYSVADPDGGCFAAGSWDYTTDEVILIDLLAIGAPDFSVPPDVFYAWQRVPGSYGDHTLFQSFFGSLFTYFFAQEWIDFGRLGRDSHPDPAKRVDWRANAVEAARANRQFVIDQATANPGRYPAYGPTSWGLTASEAPPTQLACAYCGYGALPAGTAPLHDGTIQPYGAAGVAMLVPGISIPALRHYYGATDLWRERFGLADAYNLDPEAGVGGLGHAEPWYNRALFGIDEGPLLLGIDNQRGGVSRLEVMSSPYVRRALCRVFTASLYCAPESRIRSGPAGPSKDRTPTFTFSASDAGSTFECRLDSKPFRSCTSPRTTAPLSDGPHTFAVRATGPTGVTDPTPARRTFRIDTVKPVVVELSVTPDRAFRYRLSEPARVRIAIDRLLPGRRVGKACRPPRPELRSRPRCVRAVRVTTLSQLGRRGPNRLGFSGRALSRGRYRATIRATDLAGNRSVVKRLSFSIGGG